MFAIYVSSFALSSALLVLRLVTVRFFAISITTVVFVFLLATTSWILGKQAFQDISLCPGSLSCVKVRSP